jgi:hypothetical protein
MNNTMTPEAQRIAIAEACGWKNCESSRHDVIFGDNPEGDRAVVPNYPGDLNAMHEAEETLSANQRIDFACYLTEPVRDQIYNVMPYDLHYPVCFPAIHTTARQRAEAFLRTIGKWEEST